MAINKKLIHFKEKASFKNEVANNNILDHSIVFIQDSKEISTHGTVYKTVNWSVLEKIENGLYIYDTEGNFTLSTQWNTANNSKAVGVAILTDDCRFVVAKEDISTSTINWGDSSTDISTLTNYTDAALAASDFDGVNNTRLIIEALGVGNAPAAEACDSYTFPNGKTGYLGAAGEWQVARQNKEDLNSALTLIGGTTMTEGGYWTSTEYSNNNAWRQWFDSNISLSTGLKYNPFRAIANVRAFLAL